MPSYSSIHLSIPGISPSVEPLSQSTWIVPSASILEITPESPARSLVYGSLVSRSVTRCPTRGAMVLVIPSLLSASVAVSDALLVWDTLRFQDVPVSVVLTICIVPAVYRFLAIHWCYLFPVRLNVSQLCASCSDSSCCVRAVITGRKPQVVQAEPM